MKKNIEVESANLAIVRSLKRKPLVNTVKVGVVSVHARYLQWHLLTLHQAGLLTSWLDGAWG